MGFLANARANALKWKGIDCSIKTKSGILRMVNGKVLLPGKCVTIPANEIEVDLQQGGQVIQKVGIGRVVGGAALAGPVGAVVGALAKKTDATALTLVFTTPQGVVYVDVTRENREQASNFVQNLAKAAAILNNDK